MIWFIFACQSIEKEGDSGVIESCGTANSPLAETIETLSYDNGVATSTILDQSFAFGDADFISNTLHEAVRFEFDRPTRIHGFSIQYGHLPAEGEVLAGLYPDFGYNGFDFWQEALWEGTRCISEIGTDDWVDFTLTEPFELTQPGLIYVAHRREGGFESPAWSFDQGSETDCNEWNDCHSSWNLPEVKEMVIDGGLNVAFNGFSGPMQYNYLVRLHVEPISEPPPPFFTQDPSVELASRQAWGDFNNDGFEDVFASGRLLLNDGTGSFIDISEESGISAMGLVSSGGVWGDYDNDGFLDLFVFAESGTASDALLRNEGGGVFTDVTDMANLNDIQTENDCGGEATTRPTAGAAWWDVDADGFLDLYQANFICWSEWTFYMDTVYMNNGDGTFTDVSGENGFFSRAFSGRGANPIDADGDGDVDLLVNNYTLHRNLYFRNEGDGRVAEKGLLTGLAGDATGMYYGHTIGTAWGDLDNDGDFDVIHANLAHPRFFDFSNKTQVLINDGSGVFEDIQGDWLTPDSETGLRFQETHSVPVLADIDQDGALDLAISAIYPGRPTDFYFGLGDGSFELDVLSAGLDKRNGWGATVADVDNDGDMDMAISERLYINNYPDQGEWLQIRAVGNMGSNQAGIGSSVKVKTDVGEFIRYVNGGTGQGNQNSIIAHFGLGTATVIESISLRFPSREWIVFDGPFDLNQRLWLYEDGSVVAAWHP